MTYAVILSARNGSERLPHKAMASYCPDGTPNLAQIIARWQSSRRNPIVIVATPSTPENDDIETLCASLSVPCYRGHNMTVIAQMDAALRTFAPNAEIVARALGDNPLVDVALADWRYDILARGIDGIEYTKAEIERMTYAATTDMWSRRAWDIIAAESRGEECEHPGLYYWNNLYSSKFATVHPQLPPREYLDTARTELDTEDDLEMFKRVWEAWEARFGKSVHFLVGSTPPTLWALQFLASRPDVAGINIDVPLKTQTTPVMAARGNAWVCPDCKQRGGTVDNGNLVQRCWHCGRVRKFYGHKPQARAATR